MNVPYYDRLPSNTTKCLRTTFGIVGHSCYVYFVTSTLLFGLSPLFVLHFYQLGFLQSLTTFFFVFVFCLPFGVVLPSVFGCYSYKCNVHLPDLSG